MVRDMESAGSSEVLADVESELQQR